MTDQADPRWTTSGWGYRVTSADQALRAITRVISLAPGRRYVWRGCTDRSLRLRSSLLQHLVVDESEPLPTELEMRQHELAVLRGARQWGLGPLASDLALLAELQQHGAPTRLIDVTDNPLTALWMACAGGEEAGVLVAVDVTDAPVYDTVDAHQRPSEWSLRHALAVSAKTRSPFLVAPTVRSARMQAQEGLFLSGVVPREPALPGVDGLPLRGGQPPGQKALASLLAEGERAAGRPRRLPFCAVVIPASVKKKVVQQLTAVNRRRSTVYPDVAGFRDALRDDDVELYPLPEAVSAYDDTEHAVS